MKETFPDWTAYDDWLIQNYNNYAITSLNEVDGHIEVEYMDKAEWTSIQNKKEK